MKASKFKKFRKGLPKQVEAFYKENEPLFGSIEFGALPCHSPAEIILWVIDKTGVTLEDRQLVDMWHSIVSECLDMSDITVYFAEGSRAILSQIKRERHSRARKDESAVPKVEQRFLYDSFCTSSKFGPVGDSIGPD